MVQRLLLHSVVSPGLVELETAAFQVVAQRVIEDRSVAPKGRCNVDIDECFKANKRKGERGKKKEDYTS